MAFSREKLRENIKEIQDNIATHKQEAQEVNLVAVTKYVDTDTMRALYDEEIRRFGENRANTLVKKQEELADISADVEWHFIGRLQRRPVKDIIDRIDYLHSLDRMSLIKEVNKRASNPVKCFLQVNVSGEEQKAGFNPNEVVDVIKTIEQYPNIYIVGLMTMAPYEANETDVRKYFSKLRELQQTVQQLNLLYAPCDELSMGMSRDYTVAVDEGSTYVRIGSAIYEDE